MNNSSLKSMKMVEMKQRYPILREEIKHLKKTLEEEEKRKEIFEEETNALFDRVQESNLQSA